VVAAVAFALAGCGTPGKPAPGPCTSAPAQRYRARYLQLTMAMASCFYQHHWIPASDMTGPDHQLPVHDGQLSDSTYADQQEILQWYSHEGEFLDHDGISMGSYLSDSDQDPGAWPKEVCGPVPQPSPLIPSPGP
jgi:hypothetical protein